MNPFFININVPKDDCNIGNRIKSIFDKEYTKDSYENGDERGNPNIYNEIYKDIVKLDVNPLVLSPDSAVVSSVMTGLSRKYMYNETVNGINGDSHEQFRSNLKILYIDSHPDNNLQYNRDFIGFNSSVVSNSMSQVTPTFTDHELNIYPEQITFFGLNESIIDDYSKENLKQLNCSYYNLKTLRKKGLTDVLNNIILRYNNSDDPVMVCIDLSVMNTMTCPCVYRGDYKNKGGLNHEEIYKVIKLLKNINNLVGLCITGYNFSLITDNNIKQSCDMLTSSIIREIITNLTDIKEKSINIFDEDTYFLIWRRVNNHHDYGWYILRNCPLNIREQIIQTRLLDSDTIILDRILDENGSNMDVMITKTNIKEQQLKTYHGGGTYTDCILFPEEKKSMMFELVNTPEATINGE
jgi:arginase family enzyme